MARTIIRFNGNFHKNLFVFDPYRPHKEGYKLWWNLGLLYGLIVASILQLDGMLFYESVLTENDLIQRLPRIAYVGKGRFKIWWDVLDIKVTF